MNVINTQSAAIYLILFSGVLASLFGTWNIGPASVHFYLVLLNFTCLFVFLTSVFRIKILLLMIPIVFMIILGYLRVVSGFGFLQNTYILIPFIFFILGLSLNIKDDFHEIVDKGVSLTICIFSVFYLLFFMGFNTDIDTRWSSMFIAIISMLGFLGNNKIIKYLSFSLFLCVLLSGSRGVLISLLLAIFFTKIFLSMKLRSSISVMFFTLIFFSLFFENILEYIFSIDVIRERTFYDGVYNIDKIMNFEFNSSGRDTAWPLYWNEISSRQDLFSLLIGTGAGSISEFGVKNLGVSWFHPHNEILRTLFDYGILGFMSFLIFWVLVIVQILKNSSMYFKRISLVLVVFIFFIMLTDNPLMYPLYIGNLTLFLIGCGYSFSLRKN